MRASRFVLSPWMWKIRKQKCVRFMKYFFELGDAGVILADLNIFRIG